MKLLLSGNMNVNIKLVLAKLGFKYKKLKKILFILGKSSALTLTKT